MADDVTATLETPAPNGDDAPPAAAAARELPAFVKIGGTPRFRPNELRALRVMTGRALDGLLSDPADAMQAMAWIRLRRQGFELTWDEAGEVEVELEDDMPDPTNGAPPTGSPLSVDSGV